MKILFIGDIVGSPGRGAAAKLLPFLTREEHLDFVIANAENAAGGSGITTDVAEELFHAGIDVLTSGDHIWKKRDIFELIKRQERILRPLNFPPGVAGSGKAVFSSRCGVKVGVINLQGRVFMPPLECPFRAAQEAVEELHRQCNVIIVDIHAEATSEKVALGWYLDGKVSAVLGTHTHVQTADEKILPQGTAYITDAGMTGPFDSVIGRDVQAVLEKFTSCVPVKFEVASGDIQMHGVILDIDESNGRARSIVRVQKKA